MKINYRFILSFVAPFMIVISAIGLILRENSRKIFYLPIGLMGISIILEKDVKRRLDRKNILKKIKSYQKGKQNILFIFTQHMMTIFQKRAINKINTRGAKKLNLAEIIPFEPESINFDAGKWRFDQTLVITL